MLVSVAHGPAGPPPLHKSRPGPRADPAWGALGLRHSWITHPGSKPWSASALRADRSSSRDPRTFPLQRRPGFSLARSAGSGRSVFLACEGTTSILALSTRRLTPVGVRPPCRRPSWDDLARTGGNALLEASNV